MASISNNSNNSQVIYAQTGTRQAAPAAAPGVQAGHTINQVQPQAPQVQPQAPVAQILYGTPQNQGNQPQNQGNQP